MPQEGRRRRRQNLGHRRSKVHPNKPISQVRSAPLPATSHYDTCSSRTAAADSSTSSNPKTRNEKQTNRISFLHAHTRARAHTQSPHFFSLTHSLTHPKRKNSCKNSWIPKSISKKASFQTGEKKKSKRNTHHDALVLSSSPTGSQILQQHTPRRFLTQRPRIRVADSDHKRDKSKSSSMWARALARSLVRLSSLLSSLLSPSLLRKRLASFLGWAFPFTVFWKKGGLLGFILLVLGTTPHVR